MDRTDQSASVPDPGVGFDEWAIVDVMGHQRYIGKVTEQTVAGKGFVRVDVPAVDDRPGFTKLIGPASVHSISPVDESIARKMCETTRQTPIESYQLPRLASRDADALESF
ncbi:hypothetical protein U8335_04005 [Roseiconus lacunae]|uniref:hypothetical protein n=1 Tax=Roseiconus lacunae TaxID=2605694 RepID=UPI003088421F|nr:hypothetical protein U8335_04005 [Stieleria sp. HD01]